VVCPTPIKTFARRSHDELTLAIATAVRLLLLLLLIQDS
jgi:hypothetical protein